MLAPLLMPETTRSGRCGSRPVSATCTQSEGVPLTTRAPEGVRNTVSGRVSVRAFEVPLAFCSGATTSISPSPRMASTSADKPGAR